MKLNLTIEEAIELHHEISHLTVSYYNEHLRNAIDKVTNHCQEIIDEYEELLLDKIDND